MDPNANLAELLKLASRALAGVDKCGDAMQVDYDHYRMADLIMSLDQWLRKGGALPIMWDMQLIRAREENDSQV